MNIKNKNFLKSNRFVFVICLIIIGCYCFLAYKRVINIYNVYQFKIIDFETVMLIGSLLITIIFNIFFSNKQIDIPINKYNQIILTIKFFGMSIVCYVLQIIIRNFFSISECEIMYRLANNDIETIIFASALPFIINIIMIFSLIFLSYHLLYLVDLLHKQEK